MQNLVDILKGVIIGAANIIPGVSGGTLAISMGIYNILIDAVNGFIKEPLKSIKLVWKFALGMGIGVLLAIFGVSYLFENLPIISSMLFIGLIIGSIPETWGKIEKNKIKIRDIVTICIIIALVILLGILEGNVVESANNLANNGFILFGLGILIAISIVVPGISGSALLMALGCYTTLMTIVKDTLAYIFAFDILGAFNTGKVLIFLAIGVVIGIFLTAKVIKILTEKYTNTVYWGIATLMASTPVLVMLKLNYTKITVVESIFSILMLIIGCILAKKLSKGDEK